MINGKICKGSKEVFFQLTDPEGAFLRRQQPIAQCFSDLQATVRIKRVQAARKPAGFVSSHALKPGSGASDSDKGHAGLQKPCHEAHSHQHEHCDQGADVEHDHGQALLRRVCVGHSAGRLLG